MSKHFKLDKNWHLQPIPGDTGQTYMGVNKSEKIFVKRNTSPFLAALSQEGITPKLIWTKRTSEGDILTAQEWLEGRHLTQQEIASKREVMQILAHLHHSNSLKDMLYRVGGQENTAFDRLCCYLDCLAKDLKENQYLMRVVRYLEDHLPNCDRQDFSACHGDVNHCNWLWSESGRLYLVDWDSAVLGDPAIDLGTILGRYISMVEWSNWLKLYGILPTSDITERIRWHATMNQLLEIKKYYIKQQYKEMNKEILRLKTIFAYTR